MVKSGTLNKGTLIIGVIVVIGGIGVAGWASLQIDDMGLQRYADVKMYNLYETIMVLGFTSALAGASFLLIAIIVYTFLTPKKGRAIEFQSSISSNRTNFCRSCGSRIEEDTAWCTGCGRQIG